VWYVCGRLDCCWCLLQALAFTIIGSVAFIPGFYYTRLAYYAYRGYAGYTFEDIPDLD
jgi:hypothetical protein